MSKPLKLRFIMMTCGYVESAMTSVLLYQCEFFGHPGYASYQEAITNLALDLYSKYYDEVLSIYNNRYARRVEECCRRELTKNEKASFCSTCGKAIMDKKFDAEAFCRFITDLHGTDCNSYREAEHANGRQFTWWPWQSDDFIGAPKKDVIWIAEKAEYVLLYALLDAKPELRNNEVDEDYYLARADWERFKAGKPPTYK